MKKLICRFYGKEVDGRKCKYSKCERYTCNVADETRKCFNLEVIKEDSV